MLTKMVVAIRIDNLASPNPRPNLTYEYKGYQPPAKGWAISREKMEQWDREGRLHFPKSPNGRIRRKRYLDELERRRSAKSLGRHSAHRLSSQRTHRLPHTEAIGIARTHHQSQVAAPAMSCLTPSVGVQRR